MDQAKLFYEMTLACRVEFYEEEEVTYHGRTQGKDQ